MVRKPDRRRVVQSIGAGGAAALAGCTGVLEGGDGEFPSQDIDWIIPYAAGGSYDTFARATAEYMPEYLPGDATIVPRNVTGAGSREGLNEVWRADGDGHTIGMLNNPGATVYQLILDENVDFDLRELGYLGRYERVNYSFWVDGSDPAYDSMEEMIETDETVLFASMGPSSVTHFGVQYLEHQTDLDADFMTGWDGGHEQGLAPSTGDVAASVASSTTTWVEYMENDDLQNVMYWGEEVPDYYTDIDPDIPTADEFGLEEWNAGTVLDFIAITPPDMDPDVLETIQDAWWETVHSDEFQEWADDAGRALDQEDALVGPEETRDDVMASFDLYEEDEDLLTEWIA